jgi:hypothetical protein
MAESRGFWQLDDSGQKSEGRRQKREVGSGNAEVGKTDKMAGFLKSSIFNLKSSI